MISVGLRRLLAGINIKGHLLRNKPVWWLPADCSRLYSCFQSLVQLLMSTVPVRAAHRFLNELQDLHNLKNVVFFLPLEAQNGHGHNAQPKTGTRVA